MADAIVIKVTLEPTDIAAAGKEIARKLQSALDSSISNVTATGKRVGDALGRVLKPLQRRPKMRFVSFGERGIQSRLNQEAQAEAKIRTIREKRLPTPNAMRDGLPKRKKKRFDVRKGKMGRLLS